MTADAKGAVLICTAMLLFTLNDAMLKLTGGSLPAGEVMVLRGITAGAILLVAIHLTGGSGRLRLALAPMPLIRAFCDAAASIFFVFALLDLPIATVTAFIQAVPILSSVAGAKVFGETTRRRHWISLALCMAGVLAITGVELVGNAASYASMLGAVGLMVLRDLATRSTKANIPSLSVAFTSTIAASLLSLPLMEPGSWVLPNTHAISLVIGTAVCVASGTLMLIMAMRVTSLARIAPFRYSAMVFSVLAGIWIWQEIPGVLAQIGVGLILLGGALGTRSQPPSPSGPAVIRQ